MADTVTSSADLKVGLRFDDADTRILTIPNGSSDNTEQTIKQAFQNIITNNILIGDKTGAQINGLYTAYLDNTTRTKLDITPT